MFTDDLCLRYLLPIQYSSNADQDSGFLKRGIKDFHNLYKILYFASAFARDLYCGRGRVLTVKKFVIVLLMKIKSIVVQQTKKLVRNDQITKRKRREKKKKHGDVQEEERLDKNWKKL
jgi:hypothetical protein